MTSIIRVIRDKRRGIPKDVPLDYSQISENLFIAAWPTKYHREKIISLDVTLVVATILWSVDKELGEPPLTLVHTRATDLGPRLIFPMNQLLKGVEPAVSTIHSGGKVMVFCVSGIHRSPTMTACILVGLGHPIDEAIKIVKAGRDKADIKEVYHKTIHDFEQTWKERHPQS
jgi:hypothetical protein